MTDRNRQINPYPLGAQVGQDGVRFSFVSEEPDCGIVIYDTKGNEKERIPYTEEDRFGSIYCKTVQNLNPQTLLYCFYKAQETVTDEHARRFYGKYCFGQRREKGSLKAAMITENYDWEQDQCPRIPYNNALFYCLHVRGFTKHASSGVKNKGTFSGISEKIPYLKEIGVTTLEIQPAYEFEEVTDEAESISYVSEKTDKLNYWGYKKGYYYAPKVAYSSGKDATEEFRNLVKELHRNGMELVMQFYFPKDVNRNEIPEVLRFWALQYHVDGFHLMGENLPVELLATDPMLSDRKILYYDFNGGKIREYCEKSKYPHLGEYNDSYLYDMRRFLKGDENMLNTVMKQMRYVPDNAGRIHYLSNYYGFTLADMVSYDHKHNGANGEDNRDGNDFNCSWNCGEEGKTRSLRVRQLRTRQIKNAMCMLLFSQSTPLIFMGDEFGNTQGGNNNPWCQDNGTTWLDWNMKKRNEKLLEFWKQLVEFRRMHTILHPKKEFLLMDSISCGYPDLSYHGESAWRPQTESYNRHIGIMFCGKYAETFEKKEDSFLYLAMNMHWESHDLALPKLPKGMKWEIAVMTGEEGKGNVESDNRRCVSPRSITMFIGVPVKGEKAVERQR